MAAPVAAIETATAANAVAALANVSAVVDGVAVNGIFGNEYDEAFNAVAGGVPTLHCASADVSSADQGDTVTIGATSYTIIKKRPDGTGWTTFDLQEA
mgnify:CR=1 FL=1